MRAPRIPSNESERQQALRDLDIVFTPSEERFDRITRLARRHFGVPIALISLVTDDKQWFKSAQGLSEQETGRNISFCGHAIHAEDALVIPNALKDPDFSDNPLVTGEPKIRFYAGQPIHFNGMRIGTLCLIDKRPRQMRPQDYDSLRSLAAWVDIELKQWHHNRASLIKVLQEIDQRAADLLDSETGTLSQGGLELLRERITATSDSGIPPRLLHVKVAGLDDDASVAGEQRRALAQHLRKEVGEHGIVARRGESTFLIMTQDLDSDEVEQLAQRLAAEQPELGRFMEGREKFSPEFEVDVVDRSLH